jgi:molybdopterin converting factor small subunit
MNSESNVDERYILEFIARDDGTALDSVTGLTWCRYLIGQEWQRRKAVGEPKEIPLEQVMVTIELFNKRNIGSFSDWRLPTQEELNVIMGKNKKIVGNDHNLRGENEVILVPAPTNHFWTNSAHLAQNQSVEMVVGYYGGKTARTQFTRKYARLVRG